MKCPTQNNMDANFKSFESMYSHIFLVSFLKFSDIPLLYVLLQVVYVTATFPYLVLIIFFFRGITLHGFERGLEHLFVPEVNNKTHQQMRQKVKLSIFAVYTKLI